MENDRIAIITADRYKETYDIMSNHVVPNEPNCHTCAVKWHEEFETMTLDHLFHNLSICMIANDTDRIMGIRLTGKMKKTDPPSDFLQIQNEPFKSGLSFLTHREKEGNVLSTYGVEEAIYFFLLVVHKNCRRMGLGGRLLAADVAMSRKLGFKAIKGEGSSNFSQRIYEKQGFETIIEMPYDSYFYNGQPIIIGTGEHTMTKVYGQRL